MNLFKKEPKQKIYWDVDDVIITSMEAAIKVINDNYLIPSGQKAKTVKDLKDWNMKSIYRNLTDDMMYEIFKSEEFWNNVKVKDGFKEILQDKNIKKNYDFIFLSHGDEFNLLLKTKFLWKLMEEYYNYDESKFQFIGIPCEVSKSSINMKGAIQIDDNINNLKDSNARVKILLKNFIETDYNNSIELNHKHIITFDNLYEVNDLNEIKQILDFNAKVKKDDKL